MEDVGTGKRKVEEMATGNRIGSGGNWEEPGKKTEGLNGNLSPRTQEQKAQKLRSQLKIGKTKQMSSTR